MACSEFSLYFVLQALIKFNFQAYVTNSLSFKINLKLYGVLCRPFVLLSSASRRWFLISCCAPWPLSDSIVLCKSVGITEFNEPVSIRSTAFQFNAVMSSNFCRICQRANWRQDLSCNYVDVSMISNTRAYSKFCDSFSDMFICAVMKLTSTAVDGCTIRFDVTWRLLFVMVLYVFTQKSSVHYFE